MPVHMFLPMDALGAPAYGLPVAATRQLSGACLTPSQLGSVTGAGMRENDEVCTHPRVGDVCEGWEVCHHEGGVRHCLCVDDLRDWTSRACQRPSMLVKRQI